MSHRGRAAVYAVVLAMTVLRLIAGDAPTSMSFEKDVRPILKAACFHCHGAESKPTGGLDIRLVRLLKKGGDSGPAIVPGKPDDSLLWRRIADDEMPAKGKKLTAAQKATVKRWIAEGARTARTEPNDPNLARFTDEEMNHWAFQPVKRPATPAAAGVTNPIDAFLRDDLHKQGLSFSPAADRRTLIRRATFDLIGLPPTPEEIDAFLADASPEAYERVIDRLLSSPQYGERWGRHWLDVAGFAESDGNAGRDNPRPHAHRYRDYVIRSLNADKPFDRFLREQLAGDELAPRPFDLHDPETIEKLIATGFLRMAPDVTETSNTLADRNQAVADTVKVVGAAVLGLTVGCAQCHDHRYDPMGIDDYYRLRAIFDPALNIRQWKKPSERLVDITTASEINEADCIELSAKSQEQDIDEQAVVEAKRIFDRELNKTPPADRAKAKQAVETAEAKRSPEQVALLKKYPNVKPIAFIKGFFVEYDPPTHQRFEKLRAEVRAVRALKPPRAFVMTVSEPPGAKVESRVLHRGDPEQPKQAVQPGELRVLARHRPSADLPPGPTATGTSGRRLAYARWLTDGTHPLVARAIVNRVWMHHFGRGIVATPSDFGLNGDRPSHPRLLNWLAADFVEHGWRLKRLHKLMMTAAAYRQISRRTPTLDRVDPDNRLMARMSIRRLEAEAVRDALLAVSGELVGDQFGPSSPVTEDGDGRAVFGRRKVREGLFAGVEPVGLLARRRSVYVEASRSLPLSMLETFDLPAMTPNCDARRCSTVATQALLFLNDAAVVERAEKLAERLWSERPDAGRRIRRAFALLYAAEPTARELEASLAFLNTQADHLRAGGDDAWRKRVKTQPHAPDQRALAMLCQTLMCANRFLYLD